MKIDQYLMLDSEQQWDEVWENGKFLSNFKSIDCKFQLYSLHDFFVEIELCVLTDKIIGKSAFKTGRRLEKYVDDIDISAT